MGHSTYSLLENIMYDLHNLQLSGVVPIELAGRIVFCDNMKNLLSSTI